MIRRGLIAGGVVAAVLVSAWVVPRSLDWNHYRSQITALAAARLGRPVSIAGELRLTLLPQPVLTAGGISVSDPVTGAVFTARAMQMRVGMLGLLVGRIDPEALDLDDAVLQLPWPIATDGFKMRPPEAFAATIHDGTLIIGTTRITALDGTLATFGDFGAVNVFGTAKLAGEDWGFEGTVGPIAADHESDLSAIFTGENAQDGAMLRVNGQLRDDGTLSAQMASSGPNLSRIVPGPAVSFGAEAHITAAGNVLLGNNLTLELGGEDGRGSFRWQTGNPGFSLQLATTRLDLDRWSGVWLNPAAAGGSGRFDITADAAVLGGGLLRNFHINLDRGRTLMLHQASAILPGETAFSASGTASFRGDRLAIDRGEFTLKGNDIAPTWAWLAAATPALPKLPAAGPLTADFAGSIAGTGDAITLSGVKGTLNNVVVAGSLTLARGARTKVTANISTDQLPLDRFAALNPASVLDYDLTVAAKAASFQSFTAQDASFHLIKDQTGTTLSLDRASIDGAMLTGSASETPDGSISNAVIDADAPKMAPLLAALPDGGWQVPAAAGALPVSLHAEFKGPLKALKGTVTAAAGETQLQILPVIDLPDRTATGAITLHHPGAWRLVSLLGGPDVARWVGVGSLGLIARFDAKPGHLGIDYFDMAFGGMRLAGGLGFDWANDHWALNGQVNSDRLPVAWPQLAGNEALPTDWMKRGSGKIAITAGKLTLDDTPVASDLHATLALDGGVLSVNDLAVKIGGGSASGSAAWHALDPQPAIAVNVKAANIDWNAPILGGPLDVTSGTMSGGADLTASGHTPNTWLATLAGHADLSMTGGSLNGFDIAQAQAASKIPGNLRAQNALLAAMKNGSSPFDQLHIAASIKDGGVSITDGTLTGAGSAVLAGIADLPASVLNLELTLGLPDGAPPVAARFKGPFAAPAVTVDISGFKKWLAQRKLPKNAAKRISRAKSGGNQRPSAPPGGKALPRSYQ